MDTSQAKQVFLQGLKKLSAQHTEQTLGDRRTYLGASDIGHCPRKVIMERVNPPDHDLATLIRFSRGHLAEDIVADIFDVIGYGNYERQVEIDISTDSTPILVHIDFVFTSEKQRIKSILEVKSGSIPDTPYGSWESQLHLQMGALSRKYPNYEIRGAIVSLDLSDGDLAFFNSYTPSDSLYIGLLQHAEEIWQGYQLTLKGENPELEVESGPLCGFCSAIATCPVFANIETFPDPGMDAYIREFQGYREEEKRCKNRVSSHKNSILYTVQARGPFQAGGYMFREVTRTRNNLNRTRLAQFLGEHGTSLSEFEEPSTFTYLDIKKVAKEDKDHRKAA